MTLSYGVCAGSWQRLLGNVVPHVGSRELTALHNQTSIARAYNAILESRARTVVDGDVLVLQHDDLELVDPDAEAKLLAAVAEPDVALVGVAGGAGVSGLNWWDAPRTFGRQRLQDQVLEFAHPSGDVDLLEGSLLAFSAWAVRYLRFDERYPGFHGYDDVAMVANTMGKRAIVIELDTVHHVTLGFKTAIDAEVWQRANATFRTKWQLP